MKKKTKKILALAIAVFALCLGIVEATGAVIETKNSQSDVRWEAVAELRREYYPEEADGFWRVESYEEYLRKDDYGGGDYSVFDISVSEARKGDHGEEEGERWVPINYSGYARVDLRYMPFLFKKRIVAVWTVRVWRE